MVTALYFWSYDGLKLTDFNADFKHNGYQQVSDVPFLALSRKQATTPIAHMCMVTTSSYRGAACILKVDLHTKL